MVANDSYSDELRRYAPDRYTLALFAGPNAAPALMVLYALDLELTRIKDAVSEEMIGHVRLSWWQESIEKLFAGHDIKGHPVLEALAELIEQGHVSEIVIAPLIESYREHFPELPMDAERLLDSAAQSMIRSIDPSGLGAWKKAHRTIRRHHMKHGDRFKQWLRFKLLFV